jgi:nitrogen fixation/metabolism regulation signal transduction histidine kinase
MKAGRRLAHWAQALENRVFLWALAGGLASGIFSLVVLWSGETFSDKARWTMMLLIGATWLGCAMAARERVVNPLRTLANLLEAIREGDYSIRGRRASPDDALGEVLEQVNAIGATLRAQRLGAVEAAALLGKVMHEIDVAVYTLDGEHKLKFVNRAGARLLGQAPEQLLGCHAEELDLADLIDRDDPTLAVSRAFPGGAGRWSVRRGEFRESGRKHTLLVVTDVTRALRDEELQAWQRLVRVLGHELNNSLAPIQSIAGSLGRLLAKEHRPDDWEQDMRDGLGVIASRSEALGRFIGAYSRLARVPRPRPAAVELSALLRRVASLETRLHVEVAGGEQLTVQADADLLEQALINVVRNATDASLATGGGVQISVNEDPQAIAVVVEDEGLGLANTANLFVPFFTTKPGGSGIGLVLARQIAEAHGGTLELENRTSARGCRARLTLPRG